MKKIIFYLLIPLFFLCSPVSAEEEYLLSMPPLFPVEQLTAMLHPLAVRLSEKTGNNIKLLVAKNIDHYTAEVLHGNIVIGYENPSVYVKISNVHEAIASAVMTKDENFSRGIIITRPDSGISGIEDLKGKKIMMVSRESAGGFLSQKLTLQEKGIDVERDCWLSEAAHHQEENVLLSVNIGDVDAGFIPEHALHKADRYIAPGAIIAVVKTAPLPNWVISVSRNMPRIQKEDLREILLNLTEQDPVLTSLGVSSFHNVSDADYDIIRDLVE